MIKILPPEEAKRIAAGEVVDRPAALVREFLDNAIDANSNNIEVSIEEGGCKKIEVIDDGDGMSKEDLEICTLTHATSKITCLNDLETSVTLGFRGEALAAAQAVSRLEIVTSKDGNEAWKLESGPGDSFPTQIEQHRRTKGTTVRALNLFENIPARKKFLKREASEATLCRQVFLDKALAFNKINFRFINEGKLKDFFPAVQTKKERFSNALLKNDEVNFLHEINASGSGFSVTIVIGGVELAKNDRRQMFVFANGRRVNEYSLIQAMDYGCQGWFPNGTHPVGAVFVEIDPSLADFNIHPAKREVRFKDPGSIHQAVTSALRNFFHTNYIMNKENFPHRGTENTEEEFKFDSSNQQSNQNQQSYNQITTKQNMRDFLNSIRNKLDNEKISNNESLLPADYRRTSDPFSLLPNYIGKLFNLFILIEYNDRLYIIDQHAAHERILYNKFLSDPIPKQELLAPIPFTTESDEEDSFLKNKQEELSRLGIQIKHDETDPIGTWQIEALPVNWRMGDAATVKEILNLRNAGENIAERWAATLSCKAAIKDGDYLDEETALALAQEALNLPDPRCPHGRPVWTEISKEGLLKAVKRL